MRKSRVHELWFLVMISSPRKNVSEMGEWEGKQHLTAPAWDMGNARKRTGKNNLLQLLKRA